MCCFIYKTFQIWLQYETAKKKKKGSLLYAKMDYSALRDEKWVADE